MGGTGDTEITINTEFYDASIDPQMVIALIQLNDRGLIAPKDLRGNLRSGGLIKDDRSDEDIESEAEEVSPLTGGFSE